MINMKLFIKGILILTSLLHLRPKYTIEHFLNIQNFKACWRRNCSKIAVFVPQLLFKSAQLDSSTLARRYKQMIFFKQNMQLKKNIKNFNFDVFGIKLTRPN